MIKKILMALCLSAFVLTGCKTGLQVGGDDDYQTRALVKIAVREIACEIKTSGDEQLHTTLVSVYTLAKDGTIPPELIAELSELVSDRPTLIYTVQDLMALLGVEINPTTGLMNGLTEISPEMFKAIEMGYAQGYNACKAE